VPFTKHGILRLLIRNVTGKEKPGVSAGVTRLLSPANDKQLHFAQYGGYMQSILFFCLPVCSVTGRDKLGVPSGVTRLLSPKNDKQLHFAQNGGYLQIANLQLQGHAGRSGGGGGGGVLIQQSKDGKGDYGQPATFAANLVTFT
jgi:predicted amino acid-binding ACT domain protein